MTSKMKLKYAKKKKRNFLCTAYYFSVALSPFPLLAPSSCFSPPPWHSFLHTLKNFSCFESKPQAQNIFQRSTSEDKAGSLVSPKKRAALLSWWPVDAEPWPQSFLGAAARTGPLAHVTPYPGELPLPASQQQIGMDSLLTNPLPKAVSELC